MYGEEKIQSHLQTPLFSPRLNPNPKQQRWQSKSRSIRCRIPPFLLIRVTRKRWMSKTRRDMQIRSLREGGHQQLTTNKGPQTTGALPPVLLRDYRSRSQSESVRIQTDDPYLERGTSYGRKSTVCTVEYMSFQKGQGRDYHNDIWTPSPHERQRRCSDFTKRGIHSPRTSPVTRRGCLRRRKEGSELDIIKRTRHLSQVLLLVRSPIFKRNIDTEGP